MLSSAEHELLNAHSYKKVKKLRFFKADKPVMVFLFFLLINVKMPKIAGLSMNFFITSGPDLSREQDNKHEIK